jgi:hypothetical protein
MKLALAVSSRSKTRDVKIPASSMKTLGQLQQYALLASVISPDS